MRACARACVCVCGGGGCARARVCTVRAAAHLYTNPPPTPHSFDPLCRNNLEERLYTIYKNSIPRRTLKEVLPGLVEPLLPPLCLYTGTHTKWLQEKDAAVQSSDPPPSRSKRQAVFFMPRKDPGDHPPPGMSHDPFKDPGDRPMGMGLASLFGLSDPSSTSGGEGAPPAEPLDPAVTSMLAMARMFNFRQQQAAWQARSQPQGYDPMRKPFRGGVYGDTIHIGRKRRSATAAAAEEDDESSRGAGAAESLPHVRRKRANGEEEKKGFDFGFNNFLSASAPVFPPFFFPGFFFSPSSRYQRRVFSAGYPRARANNVYNRPYAYSRRRTMYSPANAVPTTGYSTQPGRRPRLPGSTTFYGDAPPYSVFSQPPVTVQLQTLTPAVQPAAAPLPAVAGPAPVAGPALVQAALPPVAGPAPVPATPPLPVAGPALAPPVAGPAPVPAAPPLPVAGPALAPPVAVPAALPPFANPAPAVSFVPPATYPKVPPPARAIFGDTLPAYGKTTKAMKDAAPLKRVRRESSSDPSPTDVVKLGDLTIPTDTFNKMISRPDRRGKEDPHERGYQPPYQPPHQHPQPLPPLPPPPPQRGYYVPPQPYYPPPAAGFPANPYQRNYVYPRTGHYPRRRVQPTPRQVAYALRRAGYAPTRQAVYAVLRRAAAAGSYVTARQPVYAPARPMHAPLPMGAAQPFIHGTYPPY